MHQDTSKYIANSIAMRLPLQGLPLHKFNTAHSLNYPTFCISAGNANHLGLLKPVLETHVTELGPARGLRVERGTPLCSRACSATYNPKQACAQDFVRERDSLSFFHTVITLKWSFHYLRLSLNKLPLPHHCVLSACM